MALLNLKKKNNSDKEPSKKLAVAEGAKAPVVGAYSGALRRPHITEKASGSTEKGIYVFEVATNANKREVARAVALMYKVTPVKVSMVAIPAKRITVKGRPGVRPGGKKAYVYLKKGDKIELV